MRLDTRPGSQRAASATIAALLTLLPLAALVLQRGPTPGAALAERWLYLPIARPTQTPPAPAVRRRDPGRAARPRPPVPSPAPTNLAPRLPMPAIEAVPSAADEPTPASAASAPLRLDAQVLRAANQASKSPARLMAEHSGAYFGDPPASAAERLGQGVAEAAKPDCLQPGGSLLSIFVIAYQLARDRCK